MKTTKKVEEARNSKGKMTVLECDEKSKEERENKKNRTRMREQVLDETQV